MCSKSGLEYKGHGTRGWSGSTQGGHQSILASSVRLKGVGCTHGQWGTMKVAHDQVHLSAPSLQWRSGDA